MSKLLFEYANAHLTPLLPVDAAGEPLVADGVRILDVDQAAERTNLSRRELAEIWDTTYGGVVPEADVFGTPQPRIGQQDRAIRVNLTEFDKLSLEHELRYPHLKTSEFELFDTMRQAMGLPRFCRAIYPYVRTVEGRRTIELHTSIHELRRLAQNHPEYDGESEPEFCDDQENWTTVWNSDKPPVAARVTVWRRKPEGNRIEFRRTARWKAYAPVMIDDQGGTSLPHAWEKCGPEMLAKCASALANRAAFSVQLKDLYSHEEMDQARAAEAERRQTRRPPRVPVSPECQVRPDLDDDAGQIDVYDQIDDPPTSEAEFNTRLAAMIPDRHVRQSLLDAYARKWRTLFQTDRCRYWASVLLAAGRQFSQN